MANDRELGGDPLARHSMSGSELKQLLATERVGVPFLAFRAGDGSLQLIALEQSDVVTIGRSAAMDLVLDWDLEVSGVHAELQRVGDAWMIVDDGLSRNGTFLNERRVAGRQRLRNDDRVRVGKTILVFRAVRDVPGESTAISGERQLVHLTDPQRRVLVALCRPYKDDTSFATPASNQQIADEAYLSIDAVKAHLRVLFTKFALADLPQNEKRAKLAECALQFGVVTRSEL
jgi:pSer/pThr/pTyr-binding forkhead associated (FHA) protein